MTTYYVDKRGDSGGDGSSDRPFNTLAAANKAAKSGDTVLVLPGTYKEGLSIKTPNVTWRSVEKHAAVIDGGLTRDTSKIRESSGNGIGISADGVTVDGFYVTNAKNAGIASGNVSRGKILNNKIDWCYRGGILLNGTQQWMDDWEIAYNEVTRCGLMYFDPQGQGVPGTIKAGKCRRVHIHHNTVAYSYGEGINPGKRDIDALVEWNVVHTVNHAQLNCNRSVNTIVRYNILYWCADNTEHLGDGDMPPCVTWGDEGAKNEPGESEGGQVYGNLFVGRVGIDFRTTRQYDTRLSNFYFGGNTVVCPSWTWKEKKPGQLSAIEIGDNGHGRPHENALFENNIFIVADNQPHEILKNRGGLSGVTWRNNAWSKQPVTLPNMSDDIVGDLKLANPFRPITSGDESNPFSTSLAANNYAALRDYQLLAGSPCIGAASDGSEANGIKPPKVEFDVFGRRRRNMADIGAFAYGDSVEPEEPPVEEPEEPPVDPEEPDPAEGWRVHYNLAIEALARMAAAIEADEIR